MVITIDSPRGSRCRCPDFAAVLPAVAASHTARLTHSCHIDVQMNSEWMRDGLSAREGRKWFLFGS
jgi:hypothetical protein